MGTAVFAPAGAVIVMVSPVEAARLVRGLDLLEREDRAAGLGSGGRDLRDRLAHAASTARARRIEHEAGVSDPASDSSEGTGNGVMLSTSQAAESLRLTPRRVLQLNSVGQLHGTRDGGRWRFTACDVEAFKRSRSA